MPLSDKYNTNKVIEVKDNIIVGGVKIRPPWIDAESGEYLTDDQFIARENLFPFIDNIEPEYDPFYQECFIKEKENWKIFDDRVEVTFQVINTSLDNIKAREISNLADLRYKYETGGMFFTSEDGTENRVHTDRESQFKILKSSIDAEKGKFESKRWKTYNGFKELTANDFIKLNDEMSNFIQKCFDKEEQIINKINKSSTYKELKRIVKNADNEWPENSLYD